VNNVCNICHSGPVMDRCSCCEKCWYSGRYKGQQEQAASARLMLELGIPPEEVADALHRRGGR
jgi:hypothetical protein